MSFEQSKDESSQNLDSKEAQSSISKISFRNKVDEEEKKMLMENFEFIFQNQGKHKEVIKSLAQNNPDSSPAEHLKVMFFEREKDETEKKIIDLVNEETNKIRKEFSLPELNIPYENIYLIKHDAPWPAKFIEGFYSSMDQFLAIREKKVSGREYPKIVFAKNLIHEMIHFKTFNSVKGTDDFLDVKPYKEGLKTFLIREEQSFFEDLNEAVVEKLTIEILEKVKKSPLFQEDVEQTEMLKNFYQEHAPSVVDGSEYYLELFSDHDKNILWKESFTRKEERELLDTLLEKIWEKNKSAFPDKENVFQYFKKAAFTGNLIPLFRLIDETFGPKTSRTLAQKSGQPDKIKEFVFSLK